MRLVKITAMWCGACVIMNNIFDKIKENINIDVEELDYDLDDVASYNPGNVLPVFILMDGKEEIKRLIGEHTKDELIKFLEEN